MYSLNLPLNFTFEVPLKSTQVSCTISFYVPTALPTHTHFTFNPNIRHNDV